MISWDHDENENDDHDDEPVTTMSMENESVDGESDISAKSGRKHPFFHRSDSTTFVGCPPPDPFQTPLVEALPLADQPHLLQPNARREDLFGMNRQTVIPVRSCLESKSGQKVSSSRGQFEKLPIRMALSERRSGNIAPMNIPTTASSVLAQPQPGLTSFADMTFNNTSVIVKSSQAAPVAMETGQTTTMATENPYISVTVSSSHVAELPVEERIGRNDKSPENVSVIVHAGSAQVSSASDLQYPSSSVQTTPTRGEDLDRKNESQSSSSASLQSGVTTQCSTGSRLDTSSSNYDSSQQTARSSSPTPSSDARSGPCQSDALSGPCESDALSGPSQSDTLLGPSQSLPSDISSGPSLSLPSDATSGRGMSLPSYPSPGPSLSLPSDTTSGPSSSFAMDATSGPSLPSDASLDPVGTQSPDTQTLPVDSDTQPVPADDSLPQSSVTLSPQLPIVTSHISVALSGPPSLAGSNSRATPMEVAEGTSGSEPSTRSVYIVLAVIGLLKNGMWSNFAILNLKNLNGH